MQLNNFNSAWRQLKLLNSMQQIESKDILAIIDSSENTDRIKLQRILINLVMFVVVTIFCQGG